MKIYNFIDMLTTLPVIRVHRVIKQNAKYIKF